MVRIVVQNCPACGFSKYEKVFTVLDYLVSSESFDIMECNDCSLRFTSPIPDEEDISDYYKSDDYISHTGKANSIINKIYIFVQYFTLRSQRMIVERISQSLPYMPGAIETIAELKKRGMTVVCFSGGFRSATAYAKDILGYDADFSNALHHKDGKLTGLVGGDMMFNFSKGDMIVRLQNILGVSEDETLVCGDGANDLFEVFP